MCLSSWLSDSVQVEDVKVLLGEERLLIFQALASSFIRVTGIELDRVVAEFLREKIALDRLFEARGNCAFHVRQFPIYSLLCNNLGKLCVLATVY